MFKRKSKEAIQTVLDNAVQTSLQNIDGKVAAYIPELASVSEELTGVAVLTNEGNLFTAGNADDVLITLQSAAKLVVLIGLLEEVGSQRVFSWTKLEPSGDDFASLARLDQFGPMPSNPMLNAGAISLCSHIPGESEEQLAWLDQWMEKLFGEKLTLNHKVFASERRTGDRNRSLAYLMKSSNVLSTEIDQTLDTYFYLCSFEATVRQMAHLPMLLANRGQNAAGEQVISHETVRQVVSIMATCGLYNESGTHLVRTGLPAKSGVSGAILAVALGHAGIAVVSPRVNRKGTSIRGSIMLETISQELSWHFA